MDLSRRDFMLGGAAFGGLVANGETATLCLCRRKGTVIVFY